MTFANLCLAYSPQDLITGIFDTPDNMIFKPNIRARSHQIWVQSSNAPCNNTLFQVRILRLVV